MSTAKHCLLLTGLLLSSLCHADYWVGVGVADFSPDIKRVQGGELYLGGYGTWTARGPALGVHDAVTARAVYIASGANGDNAMVVLMLDSIGVPGPLTGRIAALASEKTGIPAERILVGATHSHTAPDLMGLWGGVEDDYVNYVIEQSAAAVEAAFKNSQSARLTVAAGKGRARNRRGLDHTDDDLVVLQAFSSESDKRIVSVVNFAAHPVMIGRERREVSSDFIHYLREHVEEELLAPVVYINGAIGDASPSSEKKGVDDYDTARLYGEDIATMALAAIKNSQPVSDGIVFDRRQFTTELDNWLLNLVHTIGLLDVNAGGMFWWKEVHNSMTYFSLGNELQAISVPGEALTNTALPMKKRMQAPAKMFLGLSGGCLGYFVPENEWREDGYEESLSLGPHVAGELNALAAEMIPQQLKAK